MVNCGRECLVFSRVVGYYSPLKTWNLGKLSEWKERRPYEVTKENIQEEGRETIEADLFSPGREDLENEWASASCHEATISQAVGL